MKTATALFAVLVLSSCGNPDDKPGPGGVTAGEAKALDEAAEMIEARRLPPAALQSPVAPASEAAGN